MSRTHTYTALALRVRPLGEANREAWFLTREEGILRGTVFGGPKSRLRAFVAPFHEGTLWIYHDPVRDSRKVTDFDPRVWRPGLRERYDRAMAAAAVAETILETHGGGGAWPEALALAARALDALDGAEEDACPRVLTRFLWDWAGFLGLQPDPAACAVCGREAASGEVLAYHPAQGGLLCSRCARLPGDVPGRGGLSVGSGARRWLLGADSGAAPDALAQARALAQAVLAGALGKRLPTWDSV